MLEITIAPEVIAKFKELLVEEDNEDAVSLDEREDPDEEQEIEVEGIPFVVNEDVIDSYGLKYTIAVD